jgi:uncharacterized protein YjbI with pentapeptide repeats
VQFLYESGLISGGRPVLVLTGANLSGANLSGTNLRGINLRGAYLGEAVLSEADLMGAVEITNEKLKQEAKSLTGATMPNGQKYEDWLKGKGRGEE